jgi:hypothetical protein
MPLLGDWTVGHLGDIIYAMHVPLTGRGVVVHVNDHGRGCVLGMQTGGVAAIVTVAVSPLLMLCCGVRKPRRYPCCVVECWGPHPVVLVLPHPNVPFLCRNPCDPPCIVSLLAHARRQVSRFAGGVTALTDTWRDDPAPAAPPAGDSGGHGGVAVGTTIAERFSWHRAAIDRVRGSTQQCLPTSHHDIDGNNGNDSNDSKGDITGLYNKAFTLSRTTHPQPPPPPSSSHVL